MVQSPNCIATVTVDVSTLREEDLSPKQVCGFVVDACEVFLGTLSTDDITRSYHSDLDLQGASAFGEALDKGFQDVQDNGYRLILNGIKATSYALQPDEGFEVVSAVENNF